MFGLLICSIKREVKSLVRNSSDTNVCELFYLLTTDILFTMAKIFCPNYDDLEVRCLSELLCDTYNNLSSEKRYVFLDTLYHVLGYN